MSLRSAFFSLLFLFTILAGARGQDLRISEFQATNVSGIVDEDNSHQGWIEIWNPSTTTAVALANWKLTNGTTTWTFPSVNINPDDFMIIWASGKNRTVITGPLHTNFTIPAGGGTISLLRSNNGVASSLASYPAQTADTSWGRDEWDAATTPTLVGRYSSPTPGERNSFGGSGVAGKVIFDKLSQSFTGTLVVSLSQEVVDAAAVIRYTTTGAVPTASSTAYTVPLNVTATQMIRARIFKTGLLPGETETQCFLLRDATTTAFSSAMPIVVISNFGAGQPPDTGDQNGFAWVWEPAAPDNRARFTNLPTLATRIAIDRRGSSTLNNAKYNINMEARRARSDEDRDISLLGMPEGADYVFGGPYEYDRSEIHNPFMYELSRRIGRYAPEVRLAEVFMEVTGGALNFAGTASGDYYGIYNVTEKIRRDKNRVNVAKLGPLDNGTVTKTGGYIFKIDRRDAGDTGFAAGGYTGTGTSSLGPAYYYPKEIDIFLPQSDPQEQYLTSYVNSFYAALQSGTWNNPVTGYAAWLDVDEAIDHHLLNVWPMNVDGMRLSGYWHKERGGKLIPGPIWDFDRTMESVDSRDDEARSWRSTVSDFGTDFFNYIWWDRLFADIDFYQKYIDRWQSLRRGAFAQANVNALLDSLNAQMSAEAINRDVARWAKTKRTGTFPGSPTANYDGTQAGEVLRIKDWLQVRATFMDSQWVGPVTASVVEGNVAAGTQVTLSGPVGATIRYTLNGADPRPAGGGAAGGTILIYTGTPITINETTRIRARAYNAGWTALTGANNPSLVSKWSGLTNVRFSTDALAAAGNLVVTEVNYHPSNPSAGELAVNPVFSDSDFEFIELRNIGATPIDLGGAKFTTGITFSFTGDNALTLAPAAYVIVAANPAAYAARYAAGATVVGPFTGDLDNAGEQLVLKAANNATILDFTYDDAWYPQTDGNGRTLVVYDPYAAPAAFNTAGNWRASFANKGSPGATEPNLPPTVNAGATISGLVSGVNLAAIATDDSQPAPPRALTFSWSQTGGPGTAAFTPPDATATSATFSLPGVYVLRLTANDSLLSAFSDVSVFAKDTPAAWLLRHPGIGTLNDDFDLDGANNFVEFSLGLDPNTPDVNTGPVAVLENGHLTLTYTRIKPPSAVAYAIEVADDITAFRAPNPGEVTEEILADNGLTQTVKAVDTVSTSGPPARFLRLKVSPVP